MNNQRRVSHAGNGDSVANGLATLGPQQAHLVDAAERHTREKANDESTDCAEQREHGVGRQEKNDVVREGGTHTSPPTTKSKTGDLILDAEQRGHCVIVVAGSDVVTDVRVEQFIRPVWSRRSVPRESTRTYSRSGNILSSPDSA
jgi:hypothetical protein